MSFAHVRQALNLKSVRGTARAVLIALADYADEAGAAWPSISTLAEDSGFSRTTVKDALRTLRENGIITIEARTDEAGDPTSNLYLLHFGGVGREPTHPGQDATHPGQEPTHGRAGADRQVGREPTPILSIEPTIEPTEGKSLFSEPENMPAKSPRKSEAEAITQAEAIYQAYPRKVKRPEALKAIRKAMSAHAPKFLLERTQAFAAAITPWQERQFIPHPATWFNAEQFNDDPEDWKPPSQSRTAKPRPKETADSFGI